MTDKLLLAQENLEDICLSLGVERFRKHNLKAEAKGRMSEHGAARRLLREGVEPITKAIEYMIDPERYTGGKGGRQHQAVKWCRLLGAETAAYITLKVLIDGMAMSKHTLRRAALAISGRMLDELRYRRLREKAKGLFDYTIRRFGEKKTSHYKHKKRVLDTTMRRATVQNEEGDTVLIDISDLQMQPAQRIAVGIKLLDIAMTVTGLVEKQSTHHQRIPGKRKIITDLRLVPTEETMQWLDRSNAHMEILLPVSLPMVVPPLPWDPSRRGGYLYALRDRYDITGDKRQSLEAIEQVEMPEVYAALNTVQATEWKINPDVLVLADLLRERDISMAGFPTWENIPPPPKPKDIDTNEEARKHWKHAAGLVKDENILLFVRRMEVDTIVDSADKMKGYDRIYFPMRLDFRGRMYPIPSYLHPQGADLAKALLTFANGKPLDNEGAAALAIHGANCLDAEPFNGQKLSKMSLGERMRWVLNHTDDIIAVAHHPLENRWWMEADKPFQFFAFACEWANYKYAVNHPDICGPFVSGLPCSIDGSCNGIQHYAAMLRDEPSAKSVNLLPSKKPEDLYQIISDRVVEAVLEDASNGDILASQWIQSGLINRKLCKRPTMTFGYGSRRWGFGAQILKFLVTGEEDFSMLTPDSDVPYRHQLHSSCNYLAGVVWAALGDEVVSAYTVMAWLQGITRKVVNSMNDSMTWVTPTGFPVVQVYFKMKLKQIYTIISGSLVRPTIYTETDEVLTSKHANSVAPNFVHSLDASALVLAIRSADRKGISSFGMVHDSYATVAADVGMLGDVTRETFVRMYEDHDVIQEFYEHCRRLYSGDADELPKPPRRGALDLRKVIDSDYFFS